LFVVESFDGQQHGNLSEVHLKKLPEFQRRPCMQLSSAVLLRFKVAAATEQRLI
jgi:hypothetical protein